MNKQEALAEYSRQLEEIRAAKQQLENSSAEVIRMYDGQ